MDLACNALGVSSRSLAKFFNIDFSNLHKFHLGKRSIGNDVLLPLVAIVKTMPDVPMVEPMALSDTEQQQLQKEAAYCLTESLILQRKLDFLRKQQLQALNLLNRLNIFFSTLPPDWTDRKQRWLDEQRYQASLKLEQASALNIRKLEIKVWLLEQEVRLKAGDGGDPA